LSKSPKALALCVAGAMIFSVAVVGPASAGVDSTALVAKKKGCKKGKKGADAAKKKKCKKKKKAPVPTPAPVVETLRATLTWNTLADLDFYAYLPDGTIGSVHSNTLPGSRFSANDTNGNGPETFTDLMTPTRQFSYVVCVAEDNDTDGTIATITYRTADGSNLTANSAAGLLDDDHDGGELVPPGGFNPSVSPC
jgi:hypothetical protein